MASLLGLLGAVALLVVLTVRGINLFVATPVCALVIALTSHLPMLPQLVQAAEGNLLALYMQGFTGFIANWFFMFLLGSIFGKLMELSGAAESIARWVIVRTGRAHAALAVVLACAVLTYGGVSLFVVAFSVYPTAVALFREANLPRRFIPAALSFGSVTFTMTSAGSPEIQNWIPIQFLHTSPWAAWEASLVVAVFMAVLGYWCLMAMLRRAQARGERFESRATDVSMNRTSLPHVALALLPPTTVSMVSFVLHEQLQTSALIVALLAGSAMIPLACGRHLRETGRAIAEGSTGALVAIGNTAAVVGFGTVAKAAPAFGVAVEWLAGSGEGGIAGAVFAVSIIAAITGSASGGQAIALPLLAPALLASGVNPDHIHRAVAISSGVLDSLPHNGYVVTTIRAICGETHRAAYVPVGILTVIVPGLGLLLCLALFATGL